MKSPLYQLLGVRRPRGIASTAEGHLARSRLHWADSHPVTGQRERERGLSPPARRSLPEPGRMRVTLPPGFSFLLRRRAHGRGVLKVTRILYLEQSPSEAAEPCADRGGMRFREQPAVWGSDVVGQVAGCTARMSPAPSLASLLRQWGLSAPPRGGGENPAGCRVSSALEDSRPSAGLSDLPPRPARPLVEPALSPGAWGLSSSGLCS